MKDNHLYYLAHPVRGAVSENLFFAKKWLWYLNAVANWNTIAPWIPECEVFDDGNEAERAAGMERNLIALSKCHGIVLCGPGLSTGMAIELGFAKASGLVVLDSWLGKKEPPSYSGLPL